MKNNFRFLIIDDDQVDVMVSTVKLQKNLNIDHISVVSDGREAMIWIRQNKIHDEKPLIVLLDIRMPDMDGFDFLAAYEDIDERTKNNISIFMLSSSLNPKDHLRALREKYVKALLEKPLQTALLEEYLCGL